MKILTLWLRQLLPTLAVSDRQLADDLTLRGIAVEGVHDLGSAPDGSSRGHLFEMDITTNRVDAMNHYGIAREAATMYNLPLPFLLADLPAPGRADAPFPVCIASPVADLCGRFTARVLRDVRIAESTGDVGRFFELLGQRAISNAVDASNYTLLGIGHPTHAFDLDRIRGEICVRFAHPGEPLRLLDGSERALAADDLVIADRDRAISLAGVMGGWDTMITPETRNILVEAAWFDPASVRRTARRHGLHTDASHRFERGADVNAAPLANDLVSALILQSGGGRLEGELVDIISPAIEARTSRRPPVTLSVQDVQRTLGTTVDDRNGRSALTAELVGRYLTALGCTLAPAISSTAQAVARHTLHRREDALPNDLFAVTLPSWRLDLERPIDLIEEVARVFGYNRFENTLPIALPVRDRPLERAERLVRERLLAAGFTEAISSTFANAADSELFAPVVSEHQAKPAAGSLAAAHVALQNPLSEEVSNLRPSLVPGMISMLALNLNRGVSTVRLFEEGHIFRGLLSAAPSGVPQPANADHPGVADVSESLQLALGLTTAAASASSLHRSADSPIFELKGAIEALASLFVLSPSPTADRRSSATPAPATALRFVTGNSPSWLDPARSATALLGDRPLACFGELSAVETSRHKLRQAVYLAQIDLDLLLAHPLRQTTARELSRFQAVERDFSFVFPDSIPWGEIEATIARLALPDLQSFAPVEIFRDPRGRTVPAGSYSLLLRTVFQSPSQTLTEDDLAAASHRILEALTDRGGTHRGE